ncbi:MAG: hypothetical protein HRU20_20505 [Pseudomonadales bacterium]|nr:hypothetical protein [Pseudomonadales bacterium]
MYLFSCTAKARKKLEDINIGDEKPFIVYIDYADLFGAEHLCKLYLMSEGFHEIIIEKRKQISNEQIMNLQEHDKDIQEALKSGFHLRMFESH